MPRTHYATCTLCEAACGITVETDGDRVLSVRGDPDDPHSRGYVCPKAVALTDLYDDPDRLRRPMRRTATGWEELGWDQAFDLVGDRIRDIWRRHGRDALAVYQGNPSAHNLGLLTYGQLLFRRLGTRNTYSATSTDQLPHMLSSLVMFGNQLLFPLPDVDRTDLFVIIGGNPVVSGGSIMSAPNARRRLVDLRARGGKLIVIDPRRTETAALADQHVFIRPGTDALLLLGVLHAIFEPGDGPRADPASPGRLGAFVDGMDELRAIAQKFPPEHTAAATGVPASTVRDLARALVTTERAVCYGRVGACTQEFGGLVSWLINAVNIATGHFDEPGGAMFARPAVDLVALAPRAGLQGSYDRYRSRVRGLPEFSGELPVVGLADEIETPGEGQVRALITSAGNPVLSAPNGGRLDRALAGLEFMVSIDYYLNETTRHAHVILPPVSPLERAHYDLGLALVMVRNGAKYSPPVIECGPDERQDWQIALELMSRLQVTEVGLGARQNGKTNGEGDGRASGDAKRNGGGLQGWLAGLERQVSDAFDRLVSGVAAEFVDRPLAAVIRAVGHKLGPEGLLDLGLRLGPYGSLRGGWLSLSALRTHPHGVDLGALAPCLPERLFTPDKRIQLVPDIYAADLARLERRLADASEPGNGAMQLGAMQLIGRRHLRSNNSWMHNSQRLVKGKPRCTALIHPDDARARGLADGDEVEVTSRVGAIRLPVAVSDEVMPGVISIPHGWGHNRDGVRLSIAEQHAGASINDVVDERLVDELSGTAVLNGGWVTVSPAPAAAATAEGS